MNPQRTLLDEGPDTEITAGLGTARDLFRFQRLARHSLVISVTRKCPLTCAHCITSSGPEAAGPVVRPREAALWAADLEAMSRQGLRFLSLTGGEPILALEALALLSRRAAAAGLSTFIVTSGVWASTLRAARGVVAAVGPVTRWDLGSDGWHTAGMPLGRLDHALTAILEAGGAATVRMCEGVTAAETRQMAADLRSVVRGRAPILMQSVRRLGRAVTLGPRDAGVDNGGGLPRRSCLATGLFVRADGSTGPCCAGLAYEARDRHPFDYGRVRGPGDLESAWRAWCADPLLRIMRFASLAALDGWLPETEGVDAGWPDDPCEACVALWTRLEPTEAAALHARASAPMVAAKLDLLEQALLRDYGGDDYAVLAT